MIDLPRGNMFKEEYIGDIKKTALTNFRLFNLRNDAPQQHDLAKVEPARFEQLKRKMQALHREVVAEAHDWRKE